MNAEALNIMSEAMRKLVAVAQKAVADHDIETYALASMAVSTIDKACADELNRRRKANPQPPSQIVVQMPACKAEPLVSQEVIDGIKERA